MRTERFEMRLTPDTLEEVDHWRASQFGVPSRAEAVRRLIHVGLLAASGKQEVTVSDGEKILLLMLEGIYKHLQIDGNIDPEFIVNAMMEGRYWAIQERHDYLLHNRVQDKQVVREVVDVLDMWAFIEEDYEKLSKNEKELVAAEGGPFGEHVTFRGFDQKWEGEYWSTVRFLTDHMGRFARFKGRDFYTIGKHMQGYRRMVDIFEPIRPTLVPPKRLSALQTIDLLKAEAPAK